MGTAVNNECILYKDVVVYIHVLRNGSGDNVFDISYTKKNVLNQEYSEYGYMK